MQIQVSGVVCGSLEDTNHDLLGQFCYFPRVGLLGNLSYGYAGYSHIMEVHCL